MATIRISANKIVYNADGSTVECCTDMMSPQYRADLELSNVAQCVGAVNDLRAKLIGTDMMIYARVIRGRTPNGFAAWVDASRRTLFAVHADAIA